jgi:hypothetical protein
MAQHMDKNSQVEDYKLRSKRLVIPFSIVHNATPASKTNSNDLPSSMTLALEGQTAAAAAIDSGTNFTTPVDATGNFGVLLSSLGTVSKLTKYTIDFLSSGTMTVAAKGASSSGVTASSNIAISATWSGSLATTDLSGVLTVDYQVSKA